MTAARSVTLRNALTYTIIRAHNGSRHSFVPYLPFSKDSAMTKNEAKKLHCTVEAAIAVIGGKYKTIIRRSAKDRIRFDRSWEGDRPDCPRDGQVGRRFLHPSRRGHPL